MITWWWVDEETNGERNFAGTSHGRCLLPTLACSFLNLFTTPAAPGRERVPNVQGTGVSVPVTWIF